MNTMTLIAVALAGWMNRQQQDVIEYLREEVWVLKEFLPILGAAGVKSVRLPPRSPNLNAFAERFVRTIKEECLDRMILMGDGSLRRAAGQFCEHYHREGNHQGLQNKIIEPEFGSAEQGEVNCRERLGGLLRYYYRDAA